MPSKIYLEACVRAMTYSDSAYLSVSESAAVDKKPPAVSIRNPVHCGAGSDVVEADAEVVDDVDRGPPPLLLTLHASTLVKAMLVQLSGSKPFPIRR